MSPDRDWPWSVLGLDGPPRDGTDLRRAYARALKQIDQATDISGFDALRDAYEHARWKLDHDIATAVIAPSPPPNLATPPRPDPAQPDSVGDAPTAEPVPGMISPSKGSGPREISTLPPDPAQREGTSTPLTVQGFAAQLRTVLAAERNLWLPLEKRLASVLATPLPDLPAAEAVLHEALRDLVLSHVDLRKGTLDDALSQEVLLAIDARTSWLSDFKAFHATFGHDNRLMHLLADQAFGSLEVPPLPKPPNRIDRLFNMNNKYERWILPVWFGSFGLQLVLANSSLSDTPLIWLARAIFFATFLYIGALMVITLIGEVWKAATAPFGRLWLRWKKWRHTRRRQKNTDLRP